MQHTQPTHIIFDATGHGMQMQDEPTTTADN